MTLALSGSWQDCSNLVVAFTSVQLAITIQMIEWWFLMNDKEGRLVIIVAPY